MRIRRHAPGAEAGDRGASRGAPLELRPRAGRDALLVIAAEPLQGAFVELGRRKQFDVLPCATPLAACLALERMSARIAYAIITSDPPWGIKVRQLIAEEHPEIKVVMLVA